MEIEYDVFISFKNSDKEGNYTADRELAYRLYEFLESKKLNVFFSECTLQELGTDSWKEGIKEGLKFSKIFIALGTQKEYFKSEWVQWERTTFLTRRDDDSSRAIYSYISPPMTTSELPRDISEMECFENNKLDEFERLYNFISNHLSLQKTKKKSEINIVFQKRKEEIENYITTNNLNEATLRLMDFVKDFTTERQRKNESKNIRANYSALRVEEREFGLVEKTISQYSKLRYQILDLLEDIKLDFDKKINFDNNDNSPIELVQVSLIDSFFKAKEEFKKKIDLKNRDIVFQSNQISKDYKKKKTTTFSLKPLDLSLKYGEITTLVGGNGSGKTTLINIIAGRLAQSKGDVSYPSLEQKNKKRDWYDIKTNISYIEQELPKWKGYLKDNLYYTLGANGIRGQENIDEVDFMLYRLGLEKYADAKWSEISGGYKMRFSLAKALLRKPKLLILDEPLANLDMNTQKLFLTDLRDITNSITDKISVVMSSQHIYEVEEFSDNILFFNDGEVLYNGKVENFGKNRTENCFEVNISSTEDRFIEILSKLKYIIKVEKHGRDYIIHTRRSIIYKDLLEIFLHYNIQINYFRDISISTRKLFGELK